MSDDIIGLITKYYLINKPIDIFKTMEVNNVRDNNAFILFKNFDHPYIEYIKLKKMMSL